MGIVKLRKIRCRPQRLVRRYAASFSGLHLRYRLFVNGAAYDPSGIGTQTAIGGHLYTFDAENRLVQAAEGISVAISSTNYVYDGEGQRVRKITCPAATRPCTDSSPGAVRTDFVYDAMGHLAAEYPSSGSGPIGCGTATCYLLADHLGSTRLMTDAEGNVKQRYD